MPKLEAQGISLHYEVFGDRRNPPLLLIAGLGGTGAGWGAQIERFAADHFVVLPDHRGTGQTTRAADGYTIAQHAADMAALIAHLNAGPAHVVGSSTGGAIAQLMALDHAGLVRSVTMASSFARADDFMRRQFALRRKLMAESDMQTAHGCAALFLFSPRYASQNPERVAAWIDRVAAQPPERAIALQRIDMIMAHDAFARLGEIRRPVLVICGDDDFCTPLHMSEEIAQAIPGAELTVLPGGHFIYVEQEQGFFDAVRAFIGRHDATGSR
jgi:aminoacrylate hydrolase